MTQKKEKMVKITISLPVYLLNQLKDEAKRMKKTLNEIIVQAIKEYIATHD